MYVRCALVYERDVNYMKLNEAKKERKTRKNKRVEKRNKPVMDVYIELLAWFVLCRYDKLGKKLCHSIPSNIIFISFP